MKRITSSVGLVALGAMSLQAAYAPGLSRSDSSKPWKVSAAVRGFYDDNYATAPVNEQDTIGFEVAPKVELDLVMGQTILDLSYAFSGKFFEDSSDWDLAHMFDAALRHDISERYGIKLVEQLTIAQEPDIFFGATPIRTEGDNLHNRAGVEFEGALSRAAGYRVSYYNDIFNYDQLVRSQQLDRIEHDVMLAPTWMVQENTILFVGARYHVVDFDDTTTFGNRSSESYYGFVGMDHEFNSQLTGSARFGFYQVEYDAGGDSLNPYTDLSLTYSYQELSSIQLGFKIDQSQTDVTAALSELSTGGYLVWTHQLAAKLAAKLSASLTSSEFDGGVANGQTEVFGVASLGLTYSISESLAVEGGYVYSDLDSDQPNRSYSRNRVFVGVSASF